MPRAVWHADSVSLGHEPFGRGCSSALWPGFPCADLPPRGRGAGRWLCFTLPFGFLSEALSCMLGLQWHLPFSGFFLQVYLIVAPPTTVAAHPGRRAWGHGCAAWCKLAAASHWTRAGRKQVSISCLLHAKQCFTIHKCGSIQNDTLIYILDTIGRIVADVIQRLLVQACFAKEQ